jgi:hypothetical protein
MKQVLDTPVLTRTQMTPAVIHHPHVAGPRGELAVVQRPPGPLQSIAEQVDSPLKRVGAKRYSHPQRLVLKFNIGHGPSFLLSLQSWVIHSFIEHSVRSVTVAFHSAD